MGIADHLTCFLRNLYAGREATVRTGHGTTDWFKIEKGVCQGCILSPCLFNFYAEYIMWNARLGEAQAGIKIAGRNINNLRYTDDTTLCQKARRNRRASWQKWKRRVKKLADISERLNCTDRWIGTSVHWYHSAGHPIIWEIKNRCPFFVCFLTYLGFTGLVVWLRNNLNSN